MGDKNNSTQSTFIFNGDDSIGSLTFSRIKNLEHPIRSLQFSHSLQYFKNPFQETLPLKFPKRRLRKQGGSHILLQTQQKLAKACVRTSQLKNKQIQQNPQKKGKGFGFCHKSPFQSEEIIFQSSKNLQIQKSSQQVKLQRTERKLYKDKIFQQSLKDPILIGQQKRRVCNASYQKFAKMPQVKRNQGEGFKLNLEWKINGQHSKQRFWNRCNAQTGRERALIKINEGIQSQRRKRSSQKIMTVKNNQLTYSKQIKPERKPQRERTYRQIYNKKKQIL